MQSIKQNKEIKELVNDLKHEMHHKTFKVEEQQWKNEINGLKNQNSSKSKVLNQNQNILEKLINSETYSDASNNNSKAGSLNCTQNNFYTTSKIKSDYKYNNMNAEELEKEYQKIKNQYEQNMLEIQDKQFYQKTLKLMENRIAKQLEDLNLQMKDTEFLNNMAQKKQQKINDEVNLIQKEKNVLAFHQFQETSNQDKKQDIYQELIKRKANLKGKTNEELVEILQDYKFTENYIQEMEKTIKQQQEEIEDLDFKVEKKYQEKSSSNYIIEILDDLEHLYKVFQRPDPGFFIDDDTQTLLKFSKDKGENNMWELLESGSESSKNEELINNQNDQIQNQNFLNPSHLQKKRFPRYSKEQPNVEELAKRCSKVKIAHRLNNFYDKNKNDIEGFFNSLIKLHNDLFTQSEMLKTRIFNLEEEKKSLENDYKKIETEVQKVGEIYKQSEENQEQDFRSINYIIFNDDNSEKVITSDSLLIQLKALSLTSIQVLNIIGKSFEKVKNLTKDSQKLLDPMIETTLQQKFREKFQDYEKEIQNFLEFIDQKLQLEKQDSQTEEFKRNIQHMFSDQDVSFFVKLVGSDFLLKYFTNQGFLETQIQMKQGQDLPQVITPILNNINEDAIYNFKQITKNIMKHYEYFFCHIKELKKDLQENVLIHVPSTAASESKDVYINENYEKLQIQASQKAKKLDEDYKKEISEIKAQSLQNFDHQTAKFVDEDNKIKYMGNFNSIAQKLQIKNQNQQTEQQNNNQNKNNNNTDENNKEINNQQSIQLQQQQNPPKKPLTQRQKMKQQKRLQQQLLEQQKKEASLNSQNVQYNKQEEIEQNESILEELDYIEEMRVQQQIKIIQSQQDQYTRSRSAEPQMKRNNIQNQNNDQVKDEEYKNDIMNNNSLINNQSEAFSKKNTFNNNNRKSKEDQQSQMNSVYFKNFNNNTSRNEQKNMQNGQQNLNGEQGDNNQLKVIKVEQKKKQFYQEEKLKSMNFLVHQNEKLRKIKQLKDQQIKQEHLVQQHQKYQQQKQIKNLTFQGSPSSKQLQYKKNNIDIGSPRKYKLNEGQRFLPYIPKQSSKMAVNSQNYKVQFRSVSPNSQRQNTYISNSNGSDKEDQNIMLKSDRINNIQGQQEQKQIIYSRSPK